MADHVRRWNHPGTLAAGPWGRPRTDHPYGSRGSAPHAATVSNGGHCTSTVVQMATPEHRRGRPDPVGWWNRPGLGVIGPRGRPRSLRRRASAGASIAPRNLSPGGALSSTCLSLRWSPSVAGGEAITGALLDVMPTQWRVEWAALAGCRWRYPSLGAMSDRRPRAHVQVNYILTPQYWEPMRPR